MAWAATEEIPVLRVGQFSGMRTLLLDLIGHTGRQGPLPHRKKIEKLKLFFKIRAGKTRLGLLEMKIWVF